jgi:methionyl aminopeptidase
MIYLKSPIEIMYMREAGRIVARVHEAVREAVKPGVTTADLTKVADDVLGKHNTYSPFKNYPDRTRKYPFPSSITVSVNEELVHGIPGTRVLHEGDIVSVDCGAYYKGYVGDAAITVGVGRISSEAQRLIDVTQKALEIGIATSVVGCETRDVSKSIQRFVESNGYSVVREYCGHGVGRNMHEDPQIPNWWPTTRQTRQQWQSVKLKPGMTFALEPMVIAGGPETKELNDHWTVVSKDGTLCAHIEHTIAVTDNGPLILTLP